MVDGLCGEAGITHTKHVQQIRCIGNVPGDMAGLHKIGFRQMADVFHGQLCRIKCGNGVLKDARFAQLSLVKFRQLPNGFYREAEIGTGNVRYNVADMISGRYRACT